ncbi:MAG: hypothetical protein KFB97_12585 [Cyanobium sp. M30B3]|nr:MAG: hypothetical protein KFB97_12585 [Cyanobium sp. M30B3]
MTLFRDLQQLKNAPKRGHRFLQIPPESGRHERWHSMAQPTFTTALTLDELEANHAIY